MRAAWPPAMTAVGSQKIAVAPLADGIGDEADDAAVDRLDRVVGRATVTARGLAKAVPMFDVCGVLPGTIAKPKPWLSKSPTSTTADEAAAAARSVVTPAGMPRRYPPHRWRGCRQQGHGLGRPAVAGQGASRGRAARAAVPCQVRADPAGAAIGLADQVVAPEKRRHERGNVGRMIRGDDRVAKMCSPWPPLVPVLDRRVQAAAFARGIRADGAVAQRREYRRYSLGRRQS